MTFCSKVELAGFWLFRRSHRLPQVQYANMKMHTFMQAYFCVGRKYNMHSEDF
jgi:hypothetical protein